MKKVMFLMMSLVLGGQVMSQQASCDNCFFASIEAESNPNNNKGQIRFLTDYELLGEYDEVLEDGTVVTTLIWETSDELLDMGNCPQFECMDFSEFWFTVQNGNLIAQSNGYGHRIEPTTKDDVQTCLSIYVRDENNNLVSTQVVDCVNSTWNGNEWKFGMIEYKDIEINDVVYNTNYVDFD